MSPKVQPSNLHPMRTASKIMDRNAMVQQVKEWQDSGQKVVFTNGCFDLVHLGHVDYLEKAAALGDRLVIGVNSDASVSRLKGESRPILDLDARSRLLAALEFVSGIVAFEEDTPRELIAQLLPDILVKGADYKVEEVEGHKEVLANGGEVLLIELVEGYSTSGIIKKIKAL